MGEVSGEDFDSEFEIQVCERLQALGYDVKRQIGASGFRVDLAISDPEKPGRFLLGIECDGAQYHSSRSARDRDRLRQQVRSEEHTSELQSIMRISYAVFCLKKKNTHYN